MEKMMADFRVPFPAKRVKWRDAGQNRRVAYLEARDYMQRLDDATDGLWQDSYKESPSGIIICSVGIKFGHDWIWRSDGAGQTNIEGEKGGMSDAFKRACVKWGIGRYLYYLPKGSTDLPEWATPDGWAKLQEESEIEEE